jgi:hypothetical protein
MGMPSKKRREIINDDDTRDWVRDKDKVEANVEKIKRW